MNTANARLIAARIAELIEFASIFQARYGKQYRMKPGSPAEAWDLHQTLFDQQVAIAHLLQPDALATPLRRAAPWWKYQDAIDTGSACMMAAEASHLIACCASFEAEPRAASSPVIGTSQAVIAGLLHPSAVMVAQGEPDYHRRAS
ncbi:MAG: hypothetical protein K8I30_07100 [Anaerolineae bacterium]|nr:hypothetical protein [Anaerolineae bacterium]